MDYKRDKWSNLSCSEDKQKGDKVGQITHLLRISDLKDQRKSVMKYKSCLGEFRVQNPVLRVEE